MRCETTSSVLECALRARSTHGVHHAIVEVNIVIGVVLGLTLGLIAHVVIVVFVVAIFNRIFLYGRCTLYRRRVPSLMLLKKEWVLHVLRLILGGDGFLIVTAARKSARSRIGAFLPDLFNVRYQCP